MPKQPKLLKQKKKKTKNIETNEKQKLNEWETDESLQETKDSKTNSN